jgi:lipopolysaccharide/colanic/teichoic acid biosynthesis glycosyltransferase
MTVHPDKVGRGIPRAVEAPIAAVGLLFASPLIGLAAILVRATSAGPAFFRQERVGRWGTPFTLVKLRTMRTAGAGPQITARGDARVTAVGRLLRRTKLDELPQLWNVVRGDMSLVGPRPEVPGYVDRANRLWDRVLSVRPGITDPVTLELADEEALLARASEPERFYREKLQPAKMLRYAQYLDRRSARTDFGVLFRTVATLAFPRRRRGAPETEAAATPSESKKIGARSKRLDGG